MGLFDQTNPKSTPTTRAVWGLGSGAALGAIVLGFSREWWTLIFTVPFGALIGMLIDYQIDDGCDEDPPE